MSFVLDAFIKEMEQDQERKDEVEVPPSGESGHALRHSASHAGAFTVIPSAFVDQEGASQSTLLLARLRSSHLPKCRCTAPRMPGWE